MKKLMFMAALMLSSVATYAQQAVGTWSIQPKAGITIANLTGDVDNFDAKVGFVGGAELEYQATDMISVTGGLLYSMQGSKISDIKNNIDYLNIPVLCNVYVAKNLAVKLGAQFGFKVREDIDTGNNAVNKAFDIVKGDADAYNTFDFSIPVGLSYEYSNVVLDARYNWGVTNIAKDAPKDFKVHNSVFQITLGYKFNL